MGQGRDGTGTSVGGWEAENPEGSNVLRFLGLKVCAVPPPLLGQAGFLLLSCGSEHGVVLGETGTKLCT